LASDDESRFQRCLGRLRDGEFDTGEFIIAEAKRQQFFARLTLARGRGTDRNLLPRPSEIERVSRNHGGAKISLGESICSKGRSPAALFSRGQSCRARAAELFGRAPTHGRRRCQRAAKFGTRPGSDRFQSSSNEGDLVVHLEHGIGRFLDCRRMDGAETSGSPDHRFAEEAKLYVPLEQAFMVSRYVASGKKLPPLSSLATRNGLERKRRRRLDFRITPGKMLALASRARDQRGPCLRSRHEMAARSSNIPSPSAKRQTS